MFSQILQEYQQAKQQVVYLQAENSTRSSELHDKECVVSQLQLRVAMLEQGVSDKEHVLSQLQLRAATLEQDLSEKEHLVGQRGAGSHSAAEGKFRDQLLFQEWYFVKCIFKFNCSSISFFFTVRTAEQSSSLGIVGSQLGASF